MPDTATPDLSEASQKERALWHMRKVGEIDRKIALQEYGIGRLAARIRDLRDDGYVIDSRKDDDGIAHYSLVSEPSETGRPGNGAVEPGHGDAVGVDTAADLWRALPESSLARDYVTLLAKAAKGEVTIGALEDTIEPEAVSDWEATMWLEQDVKVDRITKTREKLCRESPLVTRAGHRKGKPTYRLHESLTVDLTE